MLLGKTVKEITARMSGLPWAMVAAICLLLLVAIPASAGINQWTGTGPDSDVVQTIAVDPVTPTTIFVGTNGGGVYKSIDDGVSWAQTNSGITSSSAMMNRFVKTIAIDPITPSTLYAGTYYGSGLFKSTNGGQDWATSANCNIYGVQSVVVDPSNPSTLYVLTDGDVFKSTDGGDNCNLTNSGLTSYYLTSLVIDPQNPNILYAGSQDGVFRSIDDGGNWVQINDGLTVPYVYSLAIDPVTTSTLYAGTPVGIFRSTDSGDSWSLLDDGPVGSRILTMVIDPTTPSTIYAGTFGHGGYKSTDGGASWSRFGSGFTNDFVIALTLNPANPATLYAGTIDGVFRSSNNAASWTRIASGFRSCDINGVTFDAVNHSTVYAGAYGSGVFKSTDGGTSWSHRSSGLSTGYVMTVQAAPDAPDTLYAGTIDGFFKSTDGGESWIALTNGLPAFGLRISAIAIAPTAPDTIFVGEFAGSGLYRSLNGGDSWTRLESFPDWNFTTLAIDRQNPSVIYAGTYSGVFRSTDSGTTWNLVTSELSNGSILSFLIDVTNSSTLYVAIQEQGIFKSTDGGTTWTGINSGLPASTVTSLAMNPATPAELYAGTGTGVYRSVNGGESWSPFNAGMETIPVNAVNVTGTTPTSIYAGTMSGVYTLASAPELAVTPSPINFGPLPLNMTATHLVTLSNAGTASLIISSPVSINGPDAALFTASTGGLHPCESLYPTLAAGESCELQVTYLTSSGTRNAFLHIDSNSINSPSLDIPLVGNVVYALTVDVQGEGAINNVFPDSPPFSCAKTTCTAWFAPGAHFILRATPATVSSFSGWSGGGCSGTGDCSLALTEDTPITAAFDLLPLVRSIDGRTSYLSLTAAFAGASSSTILQARNIAFTEDITLDRQIDITLDGGFMSDFQTVDGFTDLQGALTIRQGNLTVYNLSIR